jgi:hypothetical protein
MTAEDRQATLLRDRRAQAAQKWWPSHLRVLLVAEAPPTAPDRYFYFEDVAAQDSLFRYVCRGLFGETPTRADKRVWLDRLRSAGVGLVDLSLDPLAYPGASLAEHVDGLVRRVVELSPESVVLIKATVHDAALGPLRRAAVPVVGDRVPFPGSGQQRRFEVAFAAALAQTPLAAHLPKPSD